MYLNDREDPLDIIGPKGTTKLLTALLGVGYFKRGFKVTLKDMAGGDEVKKDGYTIRSLMVDHDVPAIAFSIEEDLRPGKFNKPKALELGIPEGPLFGELQRGNDVTINGKKITPEMVMGPRRPGRKVVYSGDTRSMPQMVEFAKDCDVLIHDSTMDHSLVEKARDYGHATAKEAAICAKDSGARKLFLTHISPRFSEDATPLEEEAKAIFENTQAAHDFLEYEVKLRE
jgi:ribonuclease Z